MGTGDRERKQEKRPARSPGTHSVFADIACSDELERERAGRMPAKSAMSERRGEEVSLNTPTPATTYGKERKSREGAPSEAYKGKGKQKHNRVIQHPSGKRYE